MEIELEHVQILRPQKGDVIVYHIDEKLSMTHMENIHRCLRDLFPTNLIGILDAGARLVVLRPDET